MSKVRLDATTFTVRGYCSTVNTELPLKDINKPYKYVGTISIHEGVAYAYGFLGEISIEDYREVRQLLKEKGVSKFIWNRHKEGDLKNVIQKIN